MPVNFLAPMFVKLFYTSGFGTHVKTMCVLPADGTAPADGQLQTKQGGTALWSDGVFDYVTAVLPALGADVTIGRAELWSQPTPADNPINVRNTSLGLVGTNQFDGTRFVSTTLTLRTGGGGNMRDVWFGIPAPNNGFQTATSGDGLGVGYIGWVGSIMGGDSVFVGRNNRFPVTALNFISKTNDALLRRARRLGEY